MKIIMISLSLLSLTLFNSPAYSEIYKWVDDKGKVHFSDSPPDQTTPVISGANQSTQKNTPYQEQVEKQQRLLDSYSQRRAEKKRQQEAEKRTQQQRQGKMKKKCASYKDYLGTGGAVYKLDANGERVFMTESELANFRAKKQAEYDKHCR